MVVGWLRSLFTILIRGESVRERHDRLADEARARAARLGVLYDPYPDAAPEKQRIRFVAIGGPFMEPVEFDGYRFSQIDHKSLVGLRRVTAGMIRAHNRLERRMGPWEEAKAARKAAKRG